jgi:hypothetical protein
VKEHIEKHKKKYTFLIFIIFAAIIIFLILVGLSIFSSSDKPKGKLNLDFDDKHIDSGDNTYLSLGAKNTGTITLNGAFKVVIDDPTSITLSYPSPELLKFSLLPGESIERRMNVTATSKAYKTYYKFTVTIEGDNTTFAKNDVILTVKSK